MRELLSLILTQALQLESELESQLESQLELELLWASAPEHTRIAAANAGRKNWITFIFTKPLNKIYKPMLVRRPF